jgi:hypothetical protein
LVRLEDVKLRVQTDYFFLKNLDKYQKHSHFETHLGGGEGGGKAEKRERAPVFLRFNLATIPLAIQGRVSWKRTKVPVSDDKNISKGKDEEEGKKRERRGKEEGKKRERRGKEEGKKRERVLTSEVCMGALRRP